MPRTTEFVVESRNSAAEAVTLEDRMELVQAAVEAEPVPLRLLQQAVALQQALEERKQKQTPN
jgi:hypothetical protein